jgi:hypothetical protein
MLGRFFQEFLDNNNNNSVYISQLKINMYININQDIKLTKEKNREREMKTGEV